MRSLLSSTPGDTQSEVGAVCGSYATKSCRPCLMPSKRVGHRPQEGIHPT